MINDIVSAVNNVLWGDGQVLIVMLLGCGLWFTWKLGAVQLRHFTHMFSLMKGSTSTTKEGISSFQALCTSLSAGLGLGRDHFWLNFHASLLKIYKNRIKIHKNQLESP